MDRRAHESYRETEILTATPQKLRLMLIEAALGRVQRALGAVVEGREADAAAETSHGRGIVAELLSGIQPDASAVARDVARVYAFLYQTLADIAGKPEETKLREAARVLEVERQTWSEVCRLLPERIHPAPREQALQQEITSPDAPAADVLPYSSPLCPAPENAPSPGGFSCEI